MKEVVVETGEGGRNICPVFPAGREQKTAECKFVLPLAAAAFSLACCISSLINLAQTALLWVRGIFFLSPLLSRAICWLLSQILSQVLSFYSPCAPLSQQERNYERRGSQTGERGTGEGWQVALVVKSLLVVRKVEVKWGNMNKENTCETLLLCL